MLRPTETLACVLPIKHFNNAGGETASRKFSCGTRALYPNLVYNAIVHLFAA
jgi:hypothetical protein